MYIINIHINIQTFTNVALFYIDKNLLIILFIDTLPLIGGDTHETKMYVVII